MHMFMSIKFTEASINRTIKAHQKVTGSKFMFKMSIVHNNVCKRYCEKMSGTFVLFGHGVY